MKATSKKVHIKACAIIPLVEERLPKMALGLVDIDLDSIIKLEWICSEIDDFDT